MTFPFSTLPEAIYGQTFYGQCVYGVAPGDGAGLFVDTGKWRSPSDGRDIFWPAENELGE